MELMTKEYLLQLDRELEAEMEQEIEKWAKSALNALKEKIQKTHIAGEEDIRGVFQVPLGRVGLSEALSKKLEAAGRDFRNARLAKNFWEFDSSMDKVTDFDQNHEKLVRYSHVSEVTKIFFPGAPNGSRLVFDLCFVANKYTRTERKFLFKKQISFFALSGYSLKFLKIFTRVCKEEGISLIKVEVCDIEISDTYVPSRCKKAIENPLVDGSSYPNARIACFGTTNLIWLHYRLDQ